MMTSRTSCIAAVFVTGLALASCGAESPGPTTPAPVVIPASTPLQFGRVHDLTLLPGESRHYSFALDGSAADLAVAFSRTGPIRLTGFGGDSTFQAADCEHDPGLTSPQECGVAPASDRGFVRLNSGGSSTVSYRLLFWPGRFGSGVPVSEGTAAQPVVISAGVPFPGTVGSSFPSVYRVRGLSPGSTHSVVVFGLSYSISVSTPGSLGSASGGPGLPAELAAIADSTLDLRVVAGGWNSSGTRYWLLVL